MAASPCGTIRSVRVLQEGTIRSKFSCTTGLLHSAAMKFSLIVAVVLLALAQGSFAQDVSDLESLGRYFEEMKNKMVQDMTEIIRNQDLANQAQTFMEEKKTQLEPLVAQIQEQLKTVAASVEEQIKPLAANVQAQLQVDNFKQQMESIFKKLTEQTMAIDN
ncbi:type-4 ice-structuring protein LS-12-like isoform X2 [Sander lucioperca]|uniref:type-4 ice-structuring protein LS-12-like isoform X2 n=1 Tax=Sander lucioperca TaxID=283035 RepID=UPI00125DB8D6|nr:type-4 ice-structuring protein LS-12-like isoform X2 [Sander lucioperca]